MGSIGIDPVALVVVGIAFVIGQIRTVPPAVRYFVMGAALGFVGVYRLTQGYRDTVNLVIIGICLALAVWNVVKGLRYRSL